MSKMAIIAAMEREIAPLVRGWQRGTLSSGEREFVVFDRDGVVAVVSGIGCKNAELAARARCGAVSSVAADISWAGRRADTKPEGRQRFYAECGRGCG